MRIGVCTAVGNVKRAVKGLDFIETTVGALLCPREDDSVFQDKLLAARASLLPVEAVNCFLPGDLKCTGPAVDAAALDEYVSVACERAAQAGIQIIVFGSGGSRRVPEGFAAAQAADQLVHNMKRWGPIAEAAAVTIVLEPLNKGECNIVNSVSEGAELVRRVGHPSIRLLADTYHMTKEGEGPDSIRRAGELLAHVHCAERDSRGPVGLTGEDQRPYFRALKD
ncbi:MAG TPA: sugar phosphate isomerase/epimerase family protein, partial [Phycisphaerae bacterium]|nr:sugar phosphate isomerase/epimerase family protein [Phycisphaerae bacterium]